LLLGWRGLEVSKVNYIISKCYLVLLATCLASVFAVPRAMALQDEGQKLPVKESGSADKQEASVRGAARRRSVSARGSARAAAGKHQQAAQVPPQPSPPTPVVVVNKSEADYLTGEASVQVNPKQPTVIKVALAQNATCVVELPASDFIYYTHEGNPQLVAIFDSPTKETDHFITLMPGTGFVAPPPGGKGPMTTITLQMQSGLVLPILVVPVSDPLYNAHRVVINYNRDEVVAARRAAGLAVNLDGKETTPAKPRARETRVGRPVSGDESEEGNETPGNPRLEADVDSTKADGKRPKKGTKPADPVAASSKALTAAVKSSSKVFTKWSASSHGMSVSLAPAVDLDDRSRLLVVAVRNDTGNPLRLVPGNPDIYVQWYDEKGSALNITEIKRLHVETTSVGGRISGGQTVYYAIVYETPITGALQKVRVSVAQTSASDEPVATDLNASSN
jgi:hypothetical protein